MDIEELTILSANFDDMLNRKDFVNAIALYERMTDSVYGALARAAPSIDLSLPPIISSFQPKSGGTFLHNRLVDLGYTEYYWGISSPFDHSEVYAIQRALRYFLRGGCTSHTHMLPLPHNIQCFESLGVDKIWVHVRNPAESTVSAYFHYKGIGHGESALGMERASHAIDEAFRLNLDLHSLDQFLLDHVDFHIAWISSWASFARHEPGLVYFTFHKDMRYIESFLSKTLSEFGGKVSIREPLGDSADDRIRVRGRSDWRNDLAQETIQAIELKLNDLERRFPEISQCL